MVPPIRVLLVHDDAKLRHALATRLRDEPDIAVVGEVADGESGIAHALALQPDVVLMDINMPVMTGIEATQRLHAQAPGIRILGLSLHQDPDVVRLLRLAGAAGFIGKSEPLAVLLAAIRALGRSDGQ